MEINKAYVAASFQTAAIEPLVSHTVKFAREMNITTVTAGGGVAANGYLRKRLKEECEKYGIKCILPEIKNCTDNAAMIAAEGLIQYNKGNFSPLDTNACAYIPLK